MEKWTFISVVVQLFFEYTFVVLDGANIVSISWKTRPQSTTPSSHSRINLGSELRIKNLYVGGTKDSTNIFSTSVFEKWLVNFSLQKGLGWGVFLQARINEISRTWLHWTLAEKPQKMLFSDKLMVLKSASFFTETSFEVELNSLLLHTQVFKVTTLACTTSSYILYAAGDCAIFAHPALFFYALNHA